MDKIEKFEFDLDISDCELVYDYVSKEEIHRPESGRWSDAIFTGRGSLKQIPVNGENEKMRISLMDKAIMETKLMEKKMKVKDEKGEDDSDSMPCTAGQLKPAGSVDDLIFEHPEDEVTKLPRRLLPVYKRGDLVKGFLVLTLKEPLEAEALKIKFVGQVQVTVRTYHRYGYYDETKYEKFVDESRTLWERDPTQKGSTVSDNFSLMSLSDSPCSSSLLAQGTHKFYIEHRIPEDAPQSMPPLVISSSNCAYLIWRLKAKIERKGTVFRYGNVATHRGVWVEHPLDIAEFSEHLNEISVEESLDTGVVHFWKTGKVTLRAVMPKAAFVKGETVPLQLEVDNQSNREISKVEAKIRLHGKARQSDSRLSLSNTINIKSEKVVEGPIGAGMCPVFNWNLPWDFSESSVDGRLLPVGTLEETKLIDARYQVVVKVKRRGFHRNLAMEIPIHIGNCNSAASRELIESEEPCLDSNIFPCT